MYNIAIIGSGYIGLVLGACLADFGNKITFADIDQEKVNRLQKGIIQIYEPNLEDIIKRNFLKNKIEFTTNVIDTIKKSNIIFIAVNTPTDEDGKANISAVKKVAETIGENINEEKIICIKSTVPVGTHKIVEEIIKTKNKKFNFEVVSIPEFLKEGTAINDFLNPDRIIIGTKSEKAFLTLKEILSSTNCVKEKIIWTDNASAETIKYVSNSFLALKISFINEIANFCDKMGVDILEITNGVGLDKRIGKEFLKPGPGFGGSCFPKDVQALITMAQEIGIDLKTLNATFEINNAQKIVVINKLKKLLNNSLEGKTIAIWGLAFKANTDDIRKTPAFDIIKLLLKEKVTIKAYDPKAMENMQLELPEIEYCSNPYETVKNADAILLLTEWQEFANLDFNKIVSLIKQPIILDTRNILNLNKLKELNFTIDTIGRSIKTNNEKVFYKNDKYIENAI